jgi:hypothetical protein
MKYAVPPLGPWIGFDVAHAASDSVVTMIVKIRMVAFVVDEVMGGLANV